MNAVDATNRSGAQEDAEPPSLLTIILDTNPHAWALIGDSLPFSKAIANLLVFINAHLAVNYANRIAVLASHSERAEWLYPTPASAQRTAKSQRANGQNGHNDGDEEMGNSEDTSGQPTPRDDANKYRPFAHVEHALTTNLRQLLQTTSPADLQTTPSTMMAGALTLALTHIAKQTVSTSSTSTSSAQFNYSDPSAASAGGNDASAASSSTSRANLALTSRILVLSVSGDLATQYIPIMNAIFACQRLSIPIDILKLSGDTVFLQQAADASGGIYMPVTTPTAHAGLLQYLMFAYLPDQTARRHLITAGEGEGVDFRAACFCHRRVVDIGYVCSICLSIFCETLPEDTCLTCGSVLSVGVFGRRPVVVQKARRKKKKRVGEAGEGGTPAPGSGVASGSGTPAG
ncbi:hypothetical protein MBLNU230_g1674t1 [Neophaeotheca triangularis]